MRKLKLIALATFIIYGSHAIYNNINTAFAFGPRVMFNCAGDYFAHCTAYSIDSEGVKDCFRRVGKDLSPSCVKELKREGLIPQQEKTSMDDYYNKHKNDLSPNEKIVISINENDKVITEKRTIISNIKQNIKNRISKIQSKFKEKDRWEGYPKYIDWKTNRRELGGEITIYGLKDRY